MSAIPTACQTNAPLPTSRSSSGASDVEVDTLSVPVKTVTQGSACSTAAVGRGTEADSFAAPAQVQNADGGNQRPTSASLTDSTDDVLATNASLADEPPNVAEEVTPSVLPSLDLADVQHNSLLDGDVTLYIGHMPRIGWCMFLQVMAFSACVGSLLLRSAVWFYKTEWPPFEFTPSYGNPVTFRPRYRPSRALIEIDRSFDSRILPQYTSATRQLPEHTIWTWLQSMCYGYDARNPAIQLPAYVFTPDTTHLGMCWDVEGQISQIGVQLQRQVHLTEIALYHPGAFVLPPEALDHLPRTLQVWGQLDVSKSTSSPLDVSLLPAQHFVTTGVSNSDGTFALLAELEYRQHPRHATYLIYPLQNPAALAPMPAFTRLILRSVRNWGSQNTTCWYRVAIHGAEENS
ncbi:hypothetical protein GGF50DRAFT_121197 [Schizophyllum commune]